MRTLSPVNDDEAIYAGWVEFMAGLKRSKSVVIRRCDVCQQQFEASSRRHVFCSDKCQDAHFNAVKTQKKMGEIEK
jgi:predicted nucleic acid-binding Zn ribbon protein